ncbi:MAG TPA: bacillithiol biosynthesis cysteine-adding enzyme BshC [Gemmatimonadales bacterium]|jgi:bacillithiol biosynthesis cysteine-adding enzyme BshC|nr:bacillithiol biosynthesis cysteine-adding enzyme BshC [Gemmatimonadales bacterium]
MSLRFVPTPIVDGPLERPQPRSNGFDPALAPAFVPSAALAAGLARLQLPGAVAITTGQQPGLFTGPLYTIHKALSAAALARLLEREWSRPVVPVFWLAGDDHDFAEASQASWIGGDGSVVTAGLPPRPPEAPLTPMYREPLGPGIVPALERLAADLPASEFRQSTLDWLERHYRPQATVAGSYGGAMAELLAPLDVLCLDSTHLAVKRAMAPHLVRALATAGDLERDLDRHIEALGTTARTSGVTVGDGASLVMLEAGLGRDRLVADGPAFVTRRSRERFDLAALQRIAAERPDRLSPNVLLRPVLESVLLPTVAYLGGPGELRYLVLTPPIYHRLGIERQQPLPRWSGVVVEPRVDRVVEKFGITLAELLEPSGALEARLVRSQLPSEAVEALGSIRAALESGYDRLAHAAATIDPTLTRPIQGVRQQAVAGTQDVEKKLVQHLKRRQETELGQLAKARAAVLPNQKPQERVLTVAPFLARYGPGLLQELAAAIEGWYALALEGPRQPS